MHYEIGGTYYLKRSYLANGIELNNYNADNVLRGSAVCLRAVTPVLSLLADTVQLATIEAVIDYCNGKESVFFVANLADLAATLEDLENET
ncbi:hypothetical protein QJS83_14905 [Bdellovibrio sp. 22V]|uniref:hypothetical protein n=1 Tax=Bdellovibrio sp. 22V TaxID=3044166 RepID=UPI002542A6FD|nr:hypothetical protein [Bdellovibrio sp. 22V]WII71752.1 hypothetical protein QJS83_14905 [Bdellovibrio sp. 22V]